MPTLNLKNISFPELFNPAGLKKLDDRFLAYLKAQKPSIFQTLLSYRKDLTLSAEQVSELMIEAAPVLEAFIAELFNIENSVFMARLEAKRHDPIFVFKSWYVLREARRKLREADQYPSFEALNTWLDNALKKGDIEGKEWQVASLGAQYLQNSDQHEKEIQLLTQWCVRAMTDAHGRDSVKGWVSFRLPERLDYQHLIDLRKEKGHLDRLEVDDANLKPREGFNLTDHGMTASEILNEANYCIYCHQNAGDFCSTGFPVKKTEPELGLKKNTLGEVMTGCPLDEKISEMNFLKKEGYCIAPLAVVMVDNPLCPATGHRICNDCMKACIYQKQTPVDIPQIETAVLVDVLNLPWGVEIYDLFTRWNPLRKNQILIKPFNGRKVLVVGMGPAGFSLAHYLTMEGCAVMGVDGLKIEPLNPKWIHEPIHDWGELDEPLEKRNASGFGGVAEYGITARWNKNFLKLIYISLMRRRPYFNLFGNVRFGGTLTVEHAFSLGFDHLSIAVGAGLPQAISIPNSLAPGMRQANDFLMTLQLMKAEAQDHLVSLQIRLPIVVIGGGLTAVDAATEAQAYYVRQVEKILFYYEILASKLGTQPLRSDFTLAELNILDEFLSHASQIRHEKKNAQREKRKPDLLSLVRKWGGVTMIYRRSIQESPAYRFNHEELKKALEEGVYYAENSIPIKVLLDKDGQTQSLVCRIKRQTDGDTGEDENEKTIPARSILVAAGSRPNVAYEFEHRGTFQRSGKFYDGFTWESGVLKEAKQPSHMKAHETPSMLTSYVKDHRYVSFLGDAHPAFQGSVVKAITSALKVYPVIMEMLSQRPPDTIPYDFFSQKIQDLFSSVVLHTKKWASDLLEVRIRCPIVCQNFRPGQFYRLQFYEAWMQNQKPTSINPQPISVPGLWVDKESGELSFLFGEETAGSEWVTRLKSGDPIAIMGPTGFRMKIPKDKETVLILGEKSSIPMAFALGKDMKALGNRVLYIGCFESALENTLASKIAEAADQVIWTVKTGEAMPVTRKQDRSFCGDFLQTLIQYTNESDNPSFIPLNEVNRIIISASPGFLHAFKKANQTCLKPIWNQNIKIIASIYGPMQCMLKGICAQCLQWQINPDTGERTKAVFACSWQDQPMELIDIDHFEQRLNQDKAQTVLFDLWRKHAQN